MCGNGSATNRRLCRVLYFCTFAACPLVGCPLACNVPDPVSRIEARHVQPPQQDEPAVQPVHRGREEEGAMKRYTASDSAAPATAYAQAVILRAPSFNQDGQCWHAEAHRHYHKAFLLPEFTTTLSTPCDPLCYITHDVTTRAWHHVPSIATPCGAAGCARLRISRRPERRILNQG